MKNCVSLIALLSVGIVLGTPLWAMEDTSSTDYSTKGIKRKATDSSSKGEDSLVDPSSEAPSKNGIKGNTSDSSDEDKNSEDPENKRVSSDSSSEDTEDLEHKMEALQKAAEEGDAKSQYELGLIMLADGNDFETKRKGREQLESAAAQDYVKAYTALGIYEPWDTDKAISWFMKAIDSDDVEARFRLGLIYYQYPRYINPLQAVQFLQSAADEGHIGALCTLGEMYEKGKGVTADKKKAADYYEKAVYKGGHGFKLGLMYLIGDGVEKDPRKAAELWSNCANRASPQDNASSQHNLGLMYQNGIGVSKDSAKAEAMFQKAQQGQQNAKEASERQRKYIEDNRARAMEDLKRIQNGKTLE